MSSLQPLRRGVSLLSAKSLSSQTTPVVANGSRLLSRQLRGPLRSSAAVRPAAPRFETQTAVNQCQVRCASSSVGTEPAKKTQLYDLHVAHGARMVPYAGFSMPIQYADLSHVESHNWTRQKASLFDVSHMYVLFSLV